MASTICHLAERVWDTQHFGFPVAHITDPDLNEEALIETLENARSRGIVLVYWAAVAETRLPEPILRRYSGKLADRKVTFRRTLSAADSMDETEIASNQFEVVEYPLSDPADDLVQLGVMAGEHSRFRLDPLVPSDRCDELFRIWTRRSTRHEIADRVLVARRQSDQFTLGLITLATHGDVGSIGLLSVHPTARRIGVGSALLNAAHRCMRHSGGRSMTVVTQLANTPACGLYRRTGYSLQQIENVYHFWPACNALSCTPNDIAATATERGG